MTKLEQNKTLSFGTVSPNHSSLPNKFKEDECFGEETEIWWNDWRDKNCMIIVMCNVPDCLDDGVVSKWETFIGLSFRVVFI